MTVARKPTIVQIHDSLPLVIDGMPRKDGGAETRLRSLIGEAARRGFRTLGYMRSRDDVEGNDSPLRTKRQYSRGSELIVAETTAADWRWARQQTDSVDATKKIERYFDTEFERLKNDGGVDLVHMHNLHDWEDRAIPSGILAAARKHGISGCPQ